MIPLVSRMTVAGAPSPETARAPVVCGQPRWVVTAPSTVSATMTSDSRIVTSLTRRQARPPAARPARITLGWSAGKDGAEAKGLCRADDRVGKHQVGQSYAELRHHDPPARPLCPGQDHLADGRGRVRIVVVVARLAVREVLLPLVDDEQCGVAGHLGGAVG